SAAAGIEHVVHQYHRLPRDGNFHLAFLHHRLGVEGGKIVAIEGNVKRAERYPPFLRCVGCSPPAAPPAERPGGGCRPGPDLRRHCSSRESHAPGGSKCAPPRRQTSAALSDGVQRNSLTYVYS